jgi:putative membrane protein
VAVDERDPRVYFAAERTLLAWIRTGLAVVGLGYVVAKLGFNLMDGVEKSDFGSAMIGSGMVLIGAVAIGIAAWQHHRFTKQLRPVEQPASYSTELAVWFASSTLIAGLILAIYVAFR